MQPGRWPHYGKNTETVGELWLGLLRFYTEDFDFREHVVCIRQHGRLTTFNKQWTSKYIVIEGKTVLHTAVHPVHEMNVASLIFSVSLFVQIK